MNHYNWYLDAKRSCIIDYDPKIGAMKSRKKYKSNFGTSKKNWNRGTFY